MRYHFTPVRIIVKKRMNSKGWLGCGEMRTLGHRWWECKLMQSLCRKIWRFLKKLKINLSKIQQFDCSPPGSSVHAVSQPIILEWVAISFSKVCSQFQDRAHIYTDSGFFLTELPGKPRSIYVHMHTSMHTHTHMLHC